MPTATINGRTCFYQDTGKGYPVLFGHSYLWDSNMWSPQLKHLSKDYRCIAVDLWSHGQSGNLHEKNYTIEQLADDYWELMQHLNIPEFAIIGLSVGGMWGAQLALKHPSAVSSLTLMDTFVGAELPEAQIEYFKLLDIIEKEQEFTTPLLDQIVPLFFSPHTLSNKKPLVQAFRDSLANIKKENIPGIVTLGRAIFSRKCLLKQLTKLSQPTLLITGKDDIPRPPSEDEEMAKYLSNVQSHVIEKAGHISSLEQPETINDYLSDFLGKTAKVSH